MDYQDYYKTLGVERGATADEIKKQYRRLARKYHPDVSKEANAEEKFKTVKEAYEVLKDSEKRKAYDQLGANWKQGQGFEPPPGWDFDQQHGAGPQGGAQFNSGADFSDFFSEVFGAAGHGRAHASGDRAHHFQQRGQDQHAKINITLAEAFNGCERSLGLQHPELNPQTGQLHMKSRTLNVKIPKGVKEGQQIRLAGQGEPGIGGAPNGDLFLEIHIQPHPLFTCEGSDIYLNLPVTPWEAALGASVTVPTLGGNINVKVPAGSQTGNKLRLKGRGLPSKTPGDQYVLLKILIPEPKDEKQRELYEQMASTMAFDPRQELMSKV